MQQDAATAHLSWKVKTFSWGVAPNPIRFLKKAKPKTFKLGVRAIKFEATHPDGIEPITVERIIFEK